MQLYPIKFTPRLFHKIWGGKHIKNWYQPASDTFENVGESWVISAVETYPTMIVNGFLAGNSLSDILEVYMSELVGEKVYEIFGNTFPLLFKFIDADDDLSIQVHPNDTYAQEYEQSLGKTEMWYVMDSDKDASIILGWKETMTPELIGAAIQEGALADCLHSYPVKEGDVALISAGMVHAMKRGTIVAEIQENSDITYRLYDYNRVGKDGKKRPLKLRQALDVLNYSPTDGKALKHFDGKPNGVENIAQTPYFTTNLLYFSRSIQRDYSLLDSFVVYMCVDGSMQLTALELVNDVTEAQMDKIAVEEQSITLSVGEAVLLPACLNDIVLTPTSETCRLLEVYIDSDLLNG